MIWHYREGGRSIGPLTEEEFQQLVADGVITSETQVWNDGAGIWRPYGSIAGSDAPHMPHLQPSGAPGAETDSVSAPLLSVGPARHAFSFSGSGSEYFRIWIVNLLLTIVTLGIYSAWAKVRRSQYFYRHMSMGGASFDYHGKPLAILKGRIIAAVLAIGLQYSPQVSMTAYSVILVVVLLIFPFLLTRSFAFRLHNSSWRSIRFRFHGMAKDAAKTLYGYGLLAAATFGLCYPALYHRLRAFGFNNASFGKTAFRLGIGAGPVFGVFVKTVFLMLGTGLAGAFLVVVGVAGIAVFTGAHTKYAFIAPVLGFALYFFVLLIVYPFFQASMTNLLWGNLRLGSGRFESIQTTRGLAAIWAKNALLTLFTLGLYWPWAAVNLARYRAQTLAFATPMGVDHFTADAESDMSAAGEEVTDVLNFDISF
ncbi:MAG TPA: DUF898 family protein [Dissulfurispiraceae bacterium]|nr:DUF898 family protein [Dissulfurispiraceae bacterium]